MAVHEVTGGNRATVDFRDSRIDSAWFREYNNLMTTTNYRNGTDDQVTDDQIRALRIEMLRAGDAVQASLCTIALASDLFEIPEIDESARPALERLGVIPEHVESDVIARMICAEAIARAQEHK